MKASKYCSNQQVVKNKRAVQRKGPKYESKGIDEFEHKPDRPVSNMILESYNKSKKGSMFDAANVAVYASHLKTDSSVMVTHRGGSPKNHAAIQKRYLDDLEELNELNDSDLYSDEEQSDEKGSVSDSSDSSDKDSDLDINDDDLMDLGTDNKKDSKTKKKDPQVKPLPLY